MIARRRRRQRQAMLQTQVIRLCYAVSRALPPLINFSSQRLAALLASVGASLLITFRRSIEAEYVREHQGSIRKSR